MKSMFLRVAMIGLIGVVLTSGRADASLTWTWSFSGTEISASGTFTTQDTADALGFYLITGITGERNGITITGLQPTGTAIPGNDGYPVDNLVRTTGPQLTGNGFGFTLADGSYSNPFWADFVTPSTYLEVYTKPSGSIFREIGVVFQASIVSAPVPEPSTLIGMLVGVSALASMRRFKPTQPMIA